MTVQPADAVDGRFRSPRSLSRPPLIDNAFGKLRPNAFNSDINDQLKAKPTAMKIRSGDLEVLDSGAVVSARGASIEFELSPGPPPFMIRMSFKDEKGDEHSIQLNAIGENSADLVLTNFNNPLGTGSNEPLPIGSFANRRLFFHFRVYSLGDKSDKHVIYTWYLGESLGDE